MERLEDLNETEMLELMKKKKGFKTRFQVHVEPKTGVRHAPIIEFTRKQTLQYVKGVGDKPSEWKNCFEHPTWNVSIAEEKYHNSRTLYISSSSRIEYKPGHEPKEEE